MSSIKRNRGRLHRRLFLWFDREISPLITYFQHFGDCMPGKLITHGVSKMTREDLQGIPTPEGSPTWTPISHYTLITALDGQLKARGINITHEEFSVQGQRLFGVMDTDYQVTEE